LKERGIVTSLRTREMRISPHFFNSDGDIDALLDVMETARRRG
jgi:selenocysteine lyase/cysteine desulfurase